MKKIISIALMLCMIFALAACGNTSTDSNTPTGAVSGESENTFGTGSATTPDTTVDTDSETNPSESTDNDNKILIAYFSRADENYGVGVIEKGNTEIIAEMIADQIGGELFHIERDTPYPAEYRACTDEAKKEQNDNARPALKEDIDISDYDVIYLGYPIWWGDLPMPVYTFIESHDWNGKTVIPFCTHEGSGISNTVPTLENKCTGATVLEGLTMTGTTAQNNKSEAKESVLHWLEIIME